MKALMKLGVGAALSALAGMSYATLLDGKTLNLLFFSGPDRNTPVDTYSNDNFVVGPGVEFPPDPFSESSEDFSDTQITLVFTATDSSPSGGFFGDRISDVLGQVGPFTSFTVNPSTTAVGFDQSRLSFDQDTLFINYAGFSFTTGDQLVFDINAPPVPEPDAYALMLFGLGAVGTVARRCRSTQQ
jgi:hypothetical protein